MKKGIRISLCTVLGIVLLLAAAVGILWGKEIATVASVEQVGDNPYLFKMEYKASYDLDEIVEADIDANTKLLDFVMTKLGRGLIKPKNTPEPQADFACTSFQVENSESEGFLFGRNYDFFKNPTLVTTSHPKSGYASIAVSDMSHFGYSLEKLPTSFGKKALCIASIYAPMDGMNERGLCVSIMALPNQASRQSTGKHAVGTTIIMRLILDRCATVQEAIDLVNSVDVRHDAKSGSGYHYLVADASGDCVAIEFDKWDGWKTSFVRKDPSASYMHITNHLLTPKYYTTEPNPEYGNPNSHSWWRYATVGEYMEAHGGMLTLSQAQDILEKVHWKDLVWPNGMVEDTQFSNVYDQSALTLSLRNWNDYENTQIFRINK